MKRVQVGREAGEPIEERRFWLHSFLDIVIQIRDTFNDHVIFSVGVLLVLGYFAGKLAEKVRLPAITGYILAGLLLGDSVTGIIHAEMTKTLRTITDVALGIIAITIGSEFSARKLRRLGRDIVVITVVQLTATFIVVSVALTILGMELPYALMLGAIASATAPAATVVIIQSLRARGDFVDTLYGVVALDDAGCVLLFAAVFAFTGKMIGATLDVMEGTLQMVGHAIGEIVFSLVLGVAEGVALHVLTHRNRRENEMLILSLGCIFLFTAVSIALHLSPLLANMVAGALVVNIPNRGNAALRVLTPLTPPLYAAFFAIAGTELKVGVLGSGWVLMIGSAYVLARAVGKYCGVWAGAGLTGAPPRVRKYLGLSMLPQAGVAIGLVLLIQASPLVAHASEEVRLALSEIANIVLFAVIMNELIGPPLSRIAIIRGAEL